MMNNKKSVIILSIFFIILFSAISAAQTPEEWPHPEDMEFDDVEVTLREADKHELENGLTVYLIEDRELPLVRGEAIIDAGNIYSPREKTGLAEITANLLRTGGTAGQPPEEIDKELEYLAAAVEFGAQDTMVTGSFSSLSDNKEEVIELFNDILRKPDFLPEKIELRRGIMEESIQRRADHPVQLAVYEFIKKMAADHPVGWFPTMESVNNIEREDIINFHERYYQPHKTSLAITGDFDADKMLHLLEETLGTWEPDEVEYPELPEFDPHPEAKVYHVQQPIQQSIIFIGHPSVKFDSTAFPPLNIANRILGGGDDNRLFRELRSKRGLAYAVGSQLTQGFEFPGYFYAYIMTGAENTGQVIELTLSEIEKIRQKEVTEQELTENRQAILNRAVYRYTSAEEIAFRQALVDFLDLDQDYYEKYIEQIQELDTQDIKNIAQKKLSPEQLIIMVVGDQNRFDKELNNFGEVENIELEF